MITNQELEEVNLSPTKKDFYQIWSELLDTAKKLSNRWDPSATNESDPGIVLLKVATALADKLFYNIDKAALEDKMPSAAQVESMRKLCDMMGYSMKYYQSAETTANITYKGDHFNSDKYPNYGIPLPMFTVLKDTDNEITYITTEEKLITTANEAYSVSCIEGQIVQCETSTDNIVNLSMLDDLYRYYLPESTIAENGVFVYNISDDVLSERWKKVTNLNTVSTQTKCYKFGYDSSLSQPYIQFPDDVGQLIEDGLEIYYVRTNGVNGNISRATLCAIEAPSVWTSDSDSSTYGWSELSTDDFTVTNTSATVNGADPEGINSAYNAYKKTIGTFDTLVTCRDYMNAIYNLFDDDGYSLCSNVIVSDIRDDINRSITLCTFNDYGISYKEQSLQTDSEDQIQMFDLMLYPFKTYRLTTKDNYDKSFTYYPENINAITNSEEIADKKTIAHNIKTPDDDELVCIKNYIQLNVRITPTTKVTASEQSSILTNVKKAIYDTFNMRKLDFGEEIPTESIKDCIKTADSRIRNVDMFEPNMLTAFEYADGEETLAASAITGHNYAATYDKLLLRNILAGRVSLFKYNTTMQCLLTERKIDDEEVQYPTSQQSAIMAMESECRFPIKGSQLYENEIIQFRAPNFTTTATLSAYVNYYAVLTKTVAANEEHYLANNECLVIIYVTSTTNDDGTTTKTTNYRYYGVGQIIKPNFTLEDSYSCETAKEYTITTVSNAKDFADILEKNIASDNGESKGEGATYLAVATKILNGGAKKHMYITNTDEQIELRSIVQVKIEPDTNENQATAYLYWTLQQYNPNNDDDLTNLGSRFVDGPTSASPSYKTYTLRDNEYIYYTDAAKTDLISYGSGTEVRLYGTLNLVLPANSDVDSDELLSYGISAVPWQKYTVDSTNRLVMREYQYINLVSGDTLNSISLSDTGITEITHSWQKCEAASYTINGETSTTLPALSCGTTEYWQVHSILQFNMGPTLSQTLQDSRDTITLYNSQNGELATLQGPDVSIKSNYLIQNAASEVSTAITKTDLETGDTQDINDFTVRVTSNVEQLIATFEDGSTETIATHNLGDVWTKIPTLRTSGTVSYKMSSTPLYAAIPDTNTYCGIIAIYADYEPDTSVGITSPTITTDATLEIYNADNYADCDTTTHWWINPAKEGTTCYPLNKGLNIIKINQSGTLTLSCANSQNVSLIVSDLDIISKSDPIDYGTLQYMQIEETNNDTRTDELLAAIAAADVNHAFYYNCPMDSSIQLDINTDAGYTMASPRTWYDYNNINNKFVISEIDSDYLSTGITISAAAKL